MWNSTTTAKELSLNESQTEFSPQPPSLAMCVSSWSPVQLESTEDLRTWLQQDGPANHIAQRENVKAQPTNVKDGPGLSRQFTRLDPDGSWVKTSGGYSQLTLDGTLVEYSETWPRQGISVSGGCYRRVPLVHHTHVKDCSLWPTPTASEGMGGGTASEALRALNGQRRASGHKVTLRAKDLHRLQFGENPRPIFYEWLMGWIPGWTGLEPLAMDRCQWWLQQHGIYSQKD